MSRTGSTNAPGTTLGCTLPDEYRTTTDQGRWNDSFDEAVLYQDSIFRYADIPKAGRSYFNPLTTKRVERMCRSPRK